MPETVQDFSLYQPIVVAPEGRGAPLIPASEALWRNGMLVRGTNWLGDTLMSLPAVWRLRSFVPEPCGLFVLCPKALAPIWQAASWVSHVVAFEGRRVRGESAATVRDLGPGVAVVMPNSFGSAWDVFGHHIRIRVGRGGRARGRLLTHRLPAWQRPPGAADCHQVTHYLEIASAFGEVAWDASFPALRVADSEAAAARLGVAPAGEAQWLALAPGAAYGPAKQWSSDGFRQVAEWWLSRGGRLVVVGTAQEQEAAQRISQGLDGTLNLAGRTDLSELMAVLSSVDLVVANDSGAMHLAAGVGTPGVAVFGSTDPSATGPLGAPWVVLREKVECAPCFRRTCARPSDQYACLTRISAETVCGAVEFVAGRAG